MVQVTATPGGLKTPEIPPEFTATYLKTQQCAQWPYYAVFKVENTVIWVIQSAYLEIYDARKAIVVFNSGDNRPFLKEGKCPPGNTILPPYNTRYVAANIGYPIGGTNFAAAITLCTKDDQKGECALQIVDFVFEGQQAFLDRFKNYIMWQLRGCEGSPGRPFLQTIFPLKQSHRGNSLVSALLHNNCDNCQERYSISIFDSPSHLASSVHQHQK